MTTYEVESQDSRHRLLASWPDLPERANHLVATFQDLKLATVAKTVLNAASRYRWRRWVQLVADGVFKEQSAQGAAGLPPLPTAAIVGGAPLGASLEEHIKALTADTDATPERAHIDSGGFVERVRFGQLGPLLWRQWCNHLEADERDELDRRARRRPGRDHGSADGPCPPGRLVPERRTAHRRGPFLARSQGPRDRDDEGEKAFQGSLVQLTSDLAGLRVESTAIDWDPDNEELLRVYSPVTVVGFWLDPECWYFGWPDPNSPDGQPTLWQHAGTLPTDTSIGDLAGFISERTAQEVWPFGGAAPSERRGIFGGRR